MSQENVEIVRAATDGYNETGDLPWGPDRSRRGVGDRPGRVGGGNLSRARGSQNHGARSRNPPGRLAVGLSRDDRVEPRERRRYLGRTVGYASERPGAQGVDHPFAPGILPATRVSPAASRERHRRRRAHLEAAADQACAPAHDVHLAIGPQPVHDEGVQERGQLLGDGLGSRVLGDGPKRLSPPPRSARRAAWRPPARSRAPRRRADRRRRATPPPTSRAR